MNPTSLAFSQYRSTAMIIGYSDYIRLPRAFSVGHHLRPTLILAIKVKSPYVLRTYGTHRLVIPAGDALCGNRTKNIYACARSRASIHASLDHEAQIVHGNVIRKVI
ncbi:hypothetical protein PCANC_00550 [Puccinia coronata f. sp. avenae]|uniref:Uncharacterized protein n=1 Tax=Puccinia coronata f. sp. avenae TaxID=200324 RepID=A0A2N5T1E5_9BASI|nr:hypothetical protein PCANC_19467 [Puccinia coronata f. sp. avenae]PLW19319.1 hypothetical protein PCASD_15219 [Puccinia coronata f. sp. avenae]PLW48402.1 hypothetical protein PCASD_02920 [Puccinia coronata f. sp. avenae]PLW58334.1 hypothetical protein PCANC_00550 [Puccinia coronata f. sp. avenae]